MAPQEVIKNLELAKAEVEWEYTLEYAVAIDEAIKAVEKQIAKKPLGGADIDGNEYLICDKCSAIVQDGDWKAEYCPDCGQRIKWGE